MLQQYLYDVHHNHKIVLHLFQCHVMQPKQDVVDLVQQILSVDNYCVFGYDLLDDLK